MTDIGNDGERAVIDGSWGYYAHLSIYRFAVPWTKSGRVLDVGSGTGYGSAYLSRQGTCITALDGSADAIAFSRARFPEVVYAVHDLNQPLPFDADTFDAVFSSNVFEHVERVDALISECARVLRRDGVLIVAVPPLTAPGAARLDMENRWHIHHIPPWAWAAKLSRWFEAVECRGHIGDLSQAALPPEAVTVREDDFQFPILAPDELEAHQSITAVFVCRTQRSEPLAESLAEREPADWCFGALASRVIGGLQDRLKQVQAEADKHHRDTADSCAEVRRGNALINQLRAEIDQAQAEHSRLRQELESERERVQALRMSTSWRITKPLRLVGRAINRR